uniref:Uncharacterized protein n=1 Tax=Arundo donax TaxID=35708 RepID=A0A0A9G1Q1_ARUDO
MRGWRRRQAGIAWGAAGKPRLAARHLRLGD